MQSLGNVCMPWAQSRKGVWGILMPIFLWRLDWAWTVSISKQVVSAQKGCRQGHQVIWGSRGDKMLQAPKSFTVNINLKLIKINTINIVQNPKDFPLYMGWLKCKRLMSAGAFNFSNAPKHVCSLFYCGTDHSFLVIS